MKKIKRLFFACLMVLGLTSMTACGGGSGKGNGGASKKDLQTLATNLENAYLNLDNLDYSKFSIEYSFHDDSGSYSTYYYDESETVRLQYDAEGFFHYYSYYVNLSDSLSEPDEKVVTESYAWIDGSVLTTTYYLRKEGYNWNNPTKIYWVEDCGSREAALEEFEDWIQSYDILDYTTAVDYVLNLNDEHIALMEIAVGAKIGNSTNKMKFTINENDGLNLDFKIDEEYEVKGNDGYVDDSSNSHYTMVIEDGVVTSYVKDEKRFNTMGGAYTSDYESTESYTFTFEWTWENPDLTGYSQY